MKIRERAGKKAVAFLVLSLGALLSGCMSQTVEPASEAQFTARDMRDLRRAIIATAYWPIPSRMRHWLR